MVMRTTRRIRSCRRRKICLSFQQIRPVHSWRTMPNPRPSERRIGQPSQRTRRTHPFISRSRPPSTSMPLQTCPARLRTTALRKRASRGNSHFFLNFAGVITMDMNHDDAFSTPFRLKPAGIAFGRVRMGTDAALAPRDSASWFSRQAITPSAPCWENGGRGSVIRWSTVKADGSTVFVNDTANGRKSRVSRHHRCHTALRQRCQSTGHSAAIQDTAVG